MDPDQALQDLLAAVEAGDRDGVEVCAHAIIAWLDHQHITPKLRRGYLRKLLVALRAWSSQFQLAMYWGRELAEERYGIPAAALSLIPDSRWPTGGMVSAKSLEPLQAEARRLGREISTLITQYTELEAQRDRLRQQLLRMRPDECEHVEWEARLILIDGGPLRAGDLVEPKE